MTIFHNADRPAQPWNINQNCVKYQNLQLLTNVHLHENNCHNEHHINYAFCGYISSLWKTPLSRPNTGDKSRHGAGGNIHRTQAKMLRGEANIFSKQPKQRQPLCKSTSWNSLQSRHTTHSSQISFVHRKQQQKNRGKSITSQATPKLTFSVSFTSVSWRVSSSD